MPDAKLGALAGAPATASKVTLCVTPLVLFQVTPVPLAIVILDGLNVLLDVRHTVPLAGVHPEGALVTSLSLLPQAMACRMCCHCRHPHRHRRRSSPRAKRLRRIDELSCQEFMTDSRPGGGRCGERREYRDAPTATIGGTQPIRSTRPPHVITRHSLRDLAFGRKVFRSGRPWSRGERETTPACNLPFCRRSGDSFHSGLSAHGFPVHYVGIANEDYNFLTTGVSVEADVWSYMRQFRACVFQPPSCRDYDAWPRPGPFPSTS